MTFKYFTQVLNCSLALTWVGGNFNPSPVGFPLITVKETVKAVTLTFCSIQ